MWFVFLKKSISYNWKFLFFLFFFHYYREYFHRDFSISKPKPVLIGILYRPPDKYNFVNSLERTLSNTNVIESKECYLLGDININLQAMN